MHLASCAPPYPEFQGRRRAAAATETNEHTVMPEALQSPDSRGRQAGRHAGRGEAVARAQGPRQAASNSVTAQQRQQRRAEQSRAGQGRAEEMRGEERRVERRGAVAFNLSRFRAILVVRRRVPSNTNSDKPAEKSD
ncbi:hypothetical protein AXG93_3384s1330 [Marchantia polymorpha subsp. ruderalis]|uniref:Uncharacterized protein n=1 Tax=Marchantia polymorpha subsp. ruderalis TaxID=1480154 RepID=A0A176WEZ8_MARPO|nr:hypothetical protein AXG93_3384s1330 [Marchantia polymorpha subsp. ruderalis]